MLGVAGRGRGGGQDRGPAPPGAGNQSACPQPRALCPGCLKDTLLAASISFLKGSCKASVGTFVPASGNPSLKLQELKD